MDHVVAPDGTSIAVERTGDGPPLVLVHGTTADRSVWSPVLSALGEQFTTIAMDRRGRGASGDADGYVIEREFEDVTAVCEAVEGDVHLLGHSYGALCALGAAPMVDSLARLVLYEPPLWTPERPAPPTSVFERMDRLVAAGAHGAVLEAFFRDLVSAPERLERYRSEPSWERRLAAAPTVPREVRAVYDYRPDPAEFAATALPTQVLLGTDSSELITASTRRAHELLPESELHRLDGQGHAAIHTAPEQFVAAVLEFLTDA